MIIFREGDFYNTGHCEIGYDHSRKNDYEDGFYQSNVSENLSVNENDIYIENHEGASDRGYGYFDHGIEEFIRMFVGVF